jgi:hypothetical protein
MSRLAKLFSLVPKSKALSLNPQNSQTLSSALIRVGPCQSEDIKQKSFHVSKDTKDTKDTTEPQRKTPHIIKDTTGRKIPHIVKSTNGESIIITTQEVNTNDGIKNVDLREHHNWFRVDDKKIYYTFCVVNGELAVLKNVDSEYYARQLIEKEMIKCSITPKSYETFVASIEENYGLFITEIVPKADN